MGAFVIPSIFTAVDKFSKPVRKMTTNVTRFAQKAEIGLARVERTARKITPSLGKIGKQFLGFASAAAISAAIIGGITFSVNAIKDFETGIVGVGKTTGIADEKLRSLGQSIVMASNDLKTVSSQKLLELAEAAGQLGVTGSENIIRFSTTLAKLETASDIQGEEGAKSIARLLTITKEGVGVVDRFASTIVGLGNTFAASESEILSVASEVSRATAAYKLNSNEILGIAAALKSLDVAPEAAGSAIGKVFRTIELATLSGGKKLNAFAKVMELTPKQVKKAFGESPLKAFKLFIKGLGRISDKGGSVAQSLIDVGLSGDRISKGIVPLATNFKLLDRGLTSAAKLWEENKALQEEFAAAQKTVANAINSISRSWSNLVIKQATAGSSLADVQRALFFVADNLGIIVKWIGIAIGSLLAFKAGLVATRAVLFLYNTALGISTFVTRGNIFALRRSKVALQAYAFAGKAATVVQWLWNAAMTANPIGLIIVAIAGLIAAVILITKNWDEWGASIIEQAGPLGATIILIETLIKNWERLKKAFSGGFSGGINVLKVTALDVVERLPEFQGITPEQFSALRSKLEADIATENNIVPETVNVPSTVQEAQRLERIETSETQQVNINVRDESGLVDIDVGNGLVPITIEPTFNF